MGITGQQTIRVIALVFLSCLLPFDGLLHASWRPSTPPEVSRSWELSAVHFTSPEEGWAVGYDRENGKGVLLRYTGGCWTSLDTSSLIPPDQCRDWRLSSVHFVSANEGWAVGSDQHNGTGVLLHYSNGSWSLVPPPMVSDSWGLSAVYFTLPTEGWAVGKDEVNGCGVLLHHSNGSWFPYDASTIISSDTSWEWELTSVHMTSIGEGWAVGYDWENGQGVLLRYSNGVWTSKDPPQMGEADWGLNSVHLTSAAEGWAVGWQYDWDAGEGRGVLLRYFNSSWSVKSPPKVSGSEWGLYSVYFSSPDLGWAVGWQFDWESDLPTGRGVVLDCVKGSWRVADPGYGGEDWELRGVHFLSPREGWAVGAEFGWGMERGVLLRYHEPSDQGGTDLTGSWSSLSQVCKNSKMGTRCSVRGSFTVRNAGQREAGASSLAFFLSEDKELSQGTDVLLRQVSVKKLSAGQGKTVKLKYALPVGRSATGMWVIAAVDYLNAVPESTEDNNLVPHLVPP